MLFLTVYGLVDGFTLSDLEDNLSKGSPVVRKEPQGNYQHFISLDMNVYDLVEANPGQFIVKKKV